MTHIWTDAQRDAAHRAARIQGMSGEPDMTVWSEGWLAGRAETIAEICRQEGHNDAEVTTSGDRAQGREIAICNRCGRKLTTTRWTDENGDGHTVHADEATVTVQVESEA